jgi:hypothetical protein
MLPAGPLSMLIRIALCLNGGASRCSMRPDHRQIADLGPGFSTLWPRRGIGLGLG